MRVALSTPPVQTTSAARAAATGAGTAAINAPSDTNAAGRYLIIPRIMVILLCLLVNDWSRGGNSDLLDRVTRHGGRSRDQRRRRGGVSSLLPERPQLAQLPLLPLQRLLPLLRVAMLPLQLVQQERNEVVIP